MPCTSSPFPLPKRMWLDTNPLIRFIPRAICNYEQLERLSMNNTGRKKEKKEEKKRNIGNRSLFKSILSAPSLLVGLMEIPSDISSLTRLDYLSLKYNFIQCIPPEIRYLTNLTK